VLVLLWIEVGPAALSGWGLTVVVGAMQYKTAKVVGASRYDVGVLLLVVMVMVVAVFAAVVVAIAAVAVAVLFFVFFLLLLMLLVLLVLGLAVAQEMSKGSVWF
jgi:hypothetical protein